VDANTPWREPPHSADGSAGSPSTASTPHLSGGRSQQGPPTASVSPVSVSRSAENIPSHPGSPVGPRPEMAMVEHVASSHSPGVALGSGSPPDPPALALHGGAALPDLSVGVEGSVAEPAVPHQEDELSTADVLTCVESVLLREGKAGSHSAGGAACDLLADDSTPHSHAPADTPSPVLGGRLYMPALMVCSLPPPAPRCSSAALCLCACVRHAREAWTPHKQLCAAEVAGGAARDAFACWQQQPSVVEPCSVGVATLALSQPPPPPAPRCPLPGNAARLAAPDAR
jgi:hypothetical protein